MGGMGTSMVIALAAVLWLVYLVPTWMRRRQYMATELNAVRLQQTLRILAETSEVPAAVRAEAEARDVAAHRRRLIEEQDRRQAIERARDAEMSKAAARTMATLKPAAAAATITHSRAAARLRFCRLTASFVVVLGMATAVAGLVTVGSGYGVLIALIGAGVSAAGLLVLSRLASVARSRAATARRLREQALDAIPVSEVEQTLPEHSVGWTPVPLPKPLYLSKPVPQRVVSDIALAAARDRALLERSKASHAAREAERREKVIPITRTASGAASGAARYAAMGHIDRADAGVTDLDDALRRRRAV